VKEPNTMQTEQFKMKGNGIYCVLVPNRDPREMSLHCTQTSPQMFEDTVLGHPEAFAFGVIENAVENTVMVIAVRTAEGAESFRALSRCAIDEQRGEALWAKHDADLAAYCLDLIKGAPTIGAAYLDLPNGRPRALVKGMVATLLELHSLSPDQYSLTELAAKLNVTTASLPGWLCTHCDPEGEPEAVFIATGMGGAQ